MNKTPNENNEKEIKEAMELLKPEHPSGKPEQLVALFEEQNPTLIIDQLGATFAWVEIKGRMKLLPCESRKMEMYLEKLYREEYKTMPSIETTTRAVRLITANAYFDGDEKYLHNRVGSLEGSFWYDLGTGKAVQCKPGSWAIEITPLLFHTFPHQKAQKEPSVTDCDAKKLLDFVPLTSKEYQCLFLVWVIACFVPEICHPLLMVFGEKGAAKSTVMRLTKDLVDPSKLGLLSPPRQEELVQQLSHHYLASYDNIRKINVNEADIFCRAITGAGMSKRKLYTDDEDVLYNFRHCVAVNGINNSIETSDLLDRSMLIEVDRIQSANRKTEREIDEKFFNLRGQILGGIFDVLSKAMLIHPEVKIKNAPRMADFTEWGYAISEALGYGGDFFLKAYMKNIERRNQEVVEADPVAFAVIKFMESHNDWQGSPTQLYSLLDEEVDAWKVDRNDWPRSPSVLGKRLREVKSNLEEVGIRFQERKDGTRRYHFTKIAADAVLPVQVSLDSMDGTDSKDGNSSTSGELGASSEITDEPLKNE